MYFGGSPPTNGLDMVNVGNKIENNSYIFFLSIWVDDSAIY